jgi:hypothetical protein
VELGKHFLDLVGHGRDDGSSGVVPSEGDAAIELAF